MKDVSGCKNKLINEINKRVVSITEQVILLLYVHLIKHSTDVIHSKAAYQTASEGRHILGFCVKPSVCAPTPSSVKSLITGCYFTSPILCVTEEISPQE